MRNYPYNEKILYAVNCFIKFESVLNSLIRMKNVDVYVTGSNARFLSKDVITVMELRRGSLKKNRKEQIIIRKELYTTWRRSA